jgi:hypothetical protein
VKERPKEPTLSTMSATTQQEGKIQARKDWDQPMARTERVLATLVTGIERRQRLLSPPSACNHKASP